MTELIQQHSELFSQASFPSDATMFYCIGAQKAGTTWLHRVLQQHDDCHVTLAKEVHYFDVLAGKVTLERRLQRCIRQIRTEVDRLAMELGPKNSKSLLRIEDTVKHIAIFSGAQDGSDGLNPYISYLLHGHKSERIICDITPSYSMLSAEKYADMASIKGSKFLFIMRDPVSRLWSQVRMAIRLKFEHENIEFNAKLYEKACYEQVNKILTSKSQELILRSDYLRTINALESVVNREDILYLFFEDLFKPEALEQLSTFLNISPFKLQPDRPMNEGVSLILNPKIEKKLRQRLAPQYEILPEKLNMQLPEKWRK